MPSVAGRHIHIKGVVQGVGFRPFVYSLATELGLAGWVLNSSSGVEIEAVGSGDQLNAFVARLEERAGRSHLANGERCDAFSLLHQVYDRRGDRDRAFGFLERMAATYPNEDLRSAYRDYVDADEALAIEPVAPSSEAQPRRSEPSRRVRSWRRMTRRPRKNRNWSTGCSDAPS